jgi:ABC-type branched-subunit amino acid transport system ATPase component
MGVLMRVIDRCIVLDHGELIARARRPRSRATRR